LSGTTRVKPRRAGSDQLVQYPPPRGFEEKGDSEGSLILLRLRRTPEAEKRKGSSGGFNPTSAPPFCGRLNMIGGVLDPRVVGPRVKKKRGQFVIPPIRGTGPL